MSDNKKGTGNFSSGLGDANDSFSMSKIDRSPIKKPSKIEISQKNPVVKPEALSTPKVQPKQEEIKPKVQETPKIVMPKIIKKDPELEKNILKVIQEVPKEELNRILNPTKESKEKLAKMDFQSRGDMSEQEKKDFVEEISKREPEPEIAQINGALVWKWQKDRKDKTRKESK